MKSVPSKIYDKNYYLTDCAGYEHFKKTKGQRLDRRLSSIAAIIPIKKGMKILEVGCGRGELSIWLAKKGCLVTGVDYSRDAILLAKNSLKITSPKVQKRCNFQNKTIKEMNFKPDSFDIILSVELLEHLYPGEQRLLLSKIKKILNQKGLFILHSEPNKLFNDIGYPFFCYPMSVVLIWLSNLLTGNKYPNLTPPTHIRSESHQLMHINEPTYRNLKKLFKRFGFKGKIYSSGIPVVKPILSWKDMVFNFLVYLYPLSNYFPVNCIFGSDFYGILKKK